MQYAIQNSFRDARTLDAYKTPIGLSDKTIVLQGFFEGFAGGSFSAQTQDGILQSCDILIPAAMENIITIDSAQHVKAALIVKFSPKGQVKI